MNLLKTSTEEFVKRLPEILEIFSSLPEKHKNVILMRTGIANGVGMTYLQIGRELGVTANRVRQIELKAYSDLHNKINNLK